MALVVTYPEIVAPLIPQVPEEDLLDTRHRALLRLLTGVTPEQAAAVEAENAKVREVAAAAAEKERLAAEKQAAKDAEVAARARATEERKQAAQPSMVEAVVKSSAFKSALRSAGTVLGREITRSIFGTSRK